MEPDDNDSTGSLVEEEEEESAVAWIKWYGDNQLSLVSPKLVT